jgi:hypothetical protein
MGFLKLFRKSLDFGGPLKVLKCAAMATFILSWPLAVSDRACTGSQHPWQSGSNSYKMQGISLSNCMCWSWLETFSRKFTPIIIIIMFTLV